MHISIIICMNTPYYSSSLIVIMFTFLQYTISIPIQSIYILTYKGIQIAHASIYIQSPAHYLLSKCLLSGFFGLCPFLISPWFYNISFRFVSFSLEFFSVLLNIFLCASTVSCTSPLVSHSINFIYTTIFLSSAVFCCAVVVVKIRSSSGQNATTETNPNSVRSYKAIYQTR